MAQKPEHIQVVPDRRYAEDNPFIADIALYHNPTQVVGTVLVHPPLELYETYLGYLEGEYGVEFTPLMKDERAILFRLGDTSDTAILEARRASMTDRHRVLSATQELINDAGRLGSLAVYLSHEPM